jgi:type VI secretion system protein VasG
VAATTWGEYKKYFEKDAALARRFQVVKVEEPSEPIAAAMLRAMAPLMERHFKVRLFDDAITEAVRLSARYISGRQLPDKAISVLDTACAKVALGQSATPAAIDDNTKLLQRLDAEIVALSREVATGLPHGERLAELRAQRGTAQVRLTALQQRFEQERSLSDEIRILRAELEAQGAQPSSDQPAARPVKPRGKAVPAPPVLSSGQAALKGKLDELTVIQGEAPMLPLQVDAHVVAEIVAAWTGIPLGKMVKDEIRTVRDLEDLLAQRVIGQPHALATVAQRIRTSRANLEDPNKPKAVFLFIGPSGVGKTETALALSDILYGGERNLVTINMSEYQEAHSVSGLKGSPPGYVGFGEGGVLTEAVRRKPYSVVLLDEVEKAHPDVLELFFQVFDKGVMDDAEGREIDFRNTVVILTSNVGSSAIMQACLNKAADDMPDAETLVEAVRPHLYKNFKPAFLGRLKAVAFTPIADETMLAIIRLKLSRIAERVHRNHRAEFMHDGALVDAVLARCTEVDSGARNVDHILNGTLLPELADTLLARMAEGEPITQIKATSGKDGRFEYKVA